MQQINLKLPLTAAAIEKLSAGDQLLLSGIIYTARDVAHQRLAALLERQESLPFELAGAVIYYVGPTPAAVGRPIGSAGPTTSSRMDKFTPTLLAAGLKGMIGKGARSPQVVQEIVKHKAVYFGAVGGAGALLSKAVKSAELIAYPELGTEAIYKLTVENFPVVVINDCWGNDLYAQRDLLAKEPT